MSHNMDEDPAVASLRASFEALKESMKESLAHLATRVGHDADWIVARQGEIDRMRADVDRCLVAIQPNTDRAIAADRRAREIEDLKKAFTAHEEGHVKNRSAIVEGGKWLAATGIGGGIVFLFDWLKHVLHW